MTPEALLRQFDAMADAPNGVPKLRELILQLAVRGKLVPQDPSDEPASVVLERIAGERQRLFEEGKIGRPKPLPPISDDEVPFEKPPGWEWVRLGAVTPFPLTDGDWVESKDQDPSGEVRLVQLADVGEGEFRDRSARFLTNDTAARLNCTPLEIGDVLIARLPNPLGRACVFPGDTRPCVTVVDVAIARCGSEGPLPRYLMHALNSGCVREQLYAFGTGTTRLRVSTGNISTVPCPLPSLAEQHRIVAKVDELMALCDQLEARQQRRAELRARLNRSTLHHLTNASDDAELAAHWQRLRESFHLLYDTPETVGELRQAVLQLAVRGKLVPQDAGDEPASVLLEWIAAERQRLFEEAKIGKPKPLPPISEDEVPFAVPDGWVWERFANVANIASNLVDPANYSDAPHVAPDSIEKGTGRLLEYRSVGEDGVRSNKHRFFRGQILYSKIRPNLSKAVLVNFEGLCSADMYPMDAHISAEYLLRYILSSTFLSMAVTSDTRVAMPKINQAELSRVLVAVPPLLEQHRIVAKINELMALCDALEARLTHAREKSEHLAASVVYHLGAA